MKLNERAIKAADDAMDNVDPDASDETIAGITADYFLIGFTTRHLSILHDVRPSTQRTIERIRKRFEQPDYQPADPTGPCPLPYDWTRKNAVGISTKDRERARQWCIDAMLAGYDVHHRSSKTSASFGRGTIAQIRAWRRKEIAHDQAWAKRTQQAQETKAVFDMLMNKKLTP
jgi:hypothetical protein